MASMLSDPNWYRGTPHFILLALAILMPSIKAAEVPKPPVKVTIVEPYPVNNKLLVAANWTLFSKVHPDDRGIYTWSYPKNLMFKPNGTTTTFTDIKAPTDPFPTVNKDSQHVKVVFSSSDGRGIPSDNRPLNIVAPEHFAEMGSPPVAMVTNIPLAAANRPFTFFDVLVVYEIQDQFHDNLASNSATYGGNSVQTMETVPWIRLIDVSRPRIQDTWMAQNSGRLVDEIKVRFRGQLLISRGQFRSNLVGKDLISVNPHVWHSRTNETRGTVYDVTNNILSVTLESVSRDGQTATVRASYTVQAR